MNDALGVRTVRRGRQSQKGDPSMVLRNRPVAQAGVSMLSSITNEPNLSAYLMSPVWLIPSKISFRALNALALITPPEQLALAASKSCITV